MTQEKIRQAYTEYLLENGKQPESVYTFCKKLKIKEVDFYQEYSSFPQIESEIWKVLFIEARSSAEQEEVYQNYSVREKLLAFLYTWIEVLKKNRSYILKSYEGFDKPIYAKRNAQLVDFKASFYDFINELLMEAKETREVEQRAIPQLLQRYPDLFWAKTLFILDFWIKDTSKSFEKTDTMIEKTVNTAFDLLGRSPLDSLFDLGKFIFQNRK
ncbi:TetR family transcriptional regulator C-terminal domain-containing protein [Emticicia sp. SJ17W-69]|uniref:TetR family transcriptional regulator C-terminal domain-containing protein n=1 Tax=Emticicia sp. SJ17W-69 TaxID=3421657 RepID=UPI003EC0ED53